MGMFPIRIIHTGSVEVVEQLGKYNRTLDPGMRFIIPFLETTKKPISTKQQIIDVPPSDMITSDNVSVTVDAVVFYKVEDPYKATYGIENYKNAVAYTTVTNLRAAIGELSLDEVLSERKTINQKLLSVVDDVTNEWGLKVLSVEIKNIELPEALDRSMQQQMTAEREKRAAILKADGEKESQIRTAEGEKQATILNAEANKEERLRTAEAKAKAKEMEADAEANYIKKVAEAQAEAIALVNKALQESGQDAAAIIALKQTDMMLEMAKNPANKLIIPSESVSSLGSISAVAEMLKK